MLSGFVVGIQDADWVGLQSRIENRGLGCRAAEAINWCAATVESRLFSSERAWGSLLVGLLWRDVGSVRR